MQKIIIAAVADNGCIGKGGELPWHFSADLKRFKELTTGHAVVMGYKTFESLAKNGMGLKDRSNIVMSRHLNLTVTKSKRAPWYVKTLDDAFQLAEVLEHSKCYIIGGAEIYRIALPLVNHLSITHIKGSYDGDTFFPGWPLTDEEWKLIDGDICENKDLFFATYQRKPWISQNL